jgi:hypothetical protein
MSAKAGVAKASAARVASDETVLNVFIVILLKKGQNKRELPTSGAPTDATREREPDERDTAHASSSERRHATHRAPTVVLVLIVVGAPTALRGAPAVRHVRVRRSGDRKRQPKTQQPRPYSHGFLLGLGGSTERRPRLEHEAAASFDP